MLFIVICPIHICTRCTRCRDVPGVWHPCRDVSWWRRRHVCYRYHHTGDKCGPRLTVCHRDVSRWWRRHVCCCCTERSRDISRGRCEVRHRCRDVPRWKRRRHIRLWCRDVYVARSCHLPSALLPRTPGFFGHSLKKRNQTLH